MLWAGGNREAVHSETQEGILGNEVKNRSGGNGNGSKSYFCLCLKGKSKDTDTLKLIWFSNVEMDFTLIALLK